MVDKWSTAEAVTTEGLRQYLNSIHLSFTYLDQISKSGWKPNMDTLKQQTSKNVEIMISEMITFRLHVSFHNLLGRTRLVQSVWEQGGEVEKSVANISYKIL